MVTSRESFTAAVADSIMLLLLKLLKGHRHQRLLYKLSVLVHLHPGLFAGISVHTLRCID